MTEPILEVNDLVKEFTVKSSKGFRAIKRVVHAVSGVSFSVAAGETVGLVGESGSGKTTVGRCVLRLVEPTAGEIRFKGRDLRAMSPRELRGLRKDFQIVFQDPYSSLDPRMTVGASIAEPLVVQGVKTDHDKRVKELLELVGLAPDHAQRFPHEFSGGQRQRVGIARSLALDPSLLVLDEPVSALDVSIQAGVVNLLEDLQDRLGLAYLFIAHDLSVVRHIADNMAVMYLGKLMEYGPSEAVYTTPAHPYTKALLSAVPTPDPAIERARQRILLQGDPPSPISPPSGCRFRTRCPIAKEVCAIEEPALIDRGQGHPVACHFPSVDAVPVTVGR